MRRVRIFILLSPSPVTIYILEKHKYVKHKTIIISSSHKSLTKYCIFSFSHVLIKTLLICVSLSKPTFILLFNECSYTL
jgi:hypothetical protein